MLLYRAYRDWTNEVEKIRSGGYGGTPCSDQQSQLIKNAINGERNTTGRGPVCVMIGPDGLAVLTETNVVVREKKNKNRRL